MKPKVPMRTEGSLWVIEHQGPCLAIDPFLYKRLAEQHRNEIDRWLESEGIDKNQTFWIKGHTVLVYQLTADGSRFARGDEAAYSVVKTTTRCPL